MTEDQAKTKICPHRQFLVRGEYVQPQSGDNSGPRCQGSDCMMWVLAKKNDPTSGYCGMGPAPP